MTKYLLSFLVLLFINPIRAQTLERVDVEGRIVVDSNDIEGVTIFNTSSNKGTITNAKGEFNLKVALNDVIEISALQFKKFTVKIDNEILKNKYLTVYLVEQINKLSEVIVTPYDMLSGNLVVDVKSIETFNPDLDAIYFGVDNVYAYDVDDYKTAVDNPLVNRNQLVNGINFKNILAMFLTEVFKSNTLKKIKDKDLPNVPVKDLTDVYGRQFIANSFNIPEDRVEAFVAYAQANSFDFSLLEEGKEVQLIEYLFGRSKEFLKAENDKKN